MSKSQFKELKAYQRAHREGFSTALSLRTHRALSWLDRAEQEADPDSKFIFLWISFNAAYANEILDRRGFSEKRLLLQFLNRLVDLDGGRLLYRAIWDQFPKSIRLLINNRYVFQPFWDYQNRLISEDEWRQMFERSTSAAIRALGRMNTKKVVAIVFDRLYVLRNQIVHGGSTWSSAVNRSQVEDGAQILGLVVPIIIHLMMGNPNQLWGDPCYPVVD